jgi:hypothetical protein
LTFVAILLACRLESQKIKMENTMSGYGQAIMLIRQKEAQQKITDSAKKKKKTSKRKPAKPGYFASRAQSMVDQYGAAGSSAFYAQAQPATAKGSRRKTIENPELTRHTTDPAPAGYGETEERLMEGETQQDPALSKSL